VFPLNASNHVQPLSEFNGEIYFLMDGDDRGHELWKTNGTSTGAVRVADLNVGSGDSYPQSLMNVNGKLFFSADDVVHGRELWVLDPESPAGDFDGDRTVDGFDFLLWQRQFGGSGSGLSADDDRDGAVNGSDLAAWQANYGAAGGAPAAEVLAATSLPADEPSTSGLHPLNVNPLIPVIGSAASLSRAEDVATLKERQDFCDEVAMPSLVSTPPSPFKKLAASIEFDSSDARNHADCSIVDAAFAADTAWQPHSSIWTPF
jgi:ELWxxDGT repeat protein